MKSCLKKYLTSLALVAASILPPQAGAQTPGTTGAVFAMTNRAGRNEVVTFRRAATGALTFTGRVATGGSGQGVDFDTQGGLTLSANRRFLYACNPASDSVTVFTVTGSRLRARQFAAVGDQPLSITLSGNLAYVLNGSVAGNGITGFTVGSDGRLTPIANSFKMLSSPIAVPGEVLFSPSGKYLIVTHKVGSVIDVFEVGADGRAGNPTPYASAGPRPFAAAFRDDGRLFVVESGLPAFDNTGVSSYMMNSLTGALSVITNSAKNAQTDGCWICITNDQNYAYTANFVNGTISSYRLGADGTATLLNGAAGSSGSDSNVTDLGMSSDSRYLYNLLRGTGAIAGYQIEANGSLTPLGNFGANTGLVPRNGPSGLAAY